MGNGSKVSGGKAMCLIPGGSARLSFDSTGVQALGVMLWMYASFPTRQFIEL